MITTFLTQPSGTSKTIPHIFWGRHDEVVLPTRTILKQACQREQWILALLQQPCVEKAATSIGIYTVTAWRISKTAEFKAGYRKARGEAYSPTVARLQPSGAAVSTRLKVRVGKTTPPASRRRAVDCVPDRATKSMELDDIEDLAELERAADRSKSENLV